MQTKNYCNACGAALRENAAFCINCGKRLVSAEASTLSATSPSAVTRPANLGANLKYCAKCKRKVSLKGQLCSVCGTDFGPTGEVNTPSRVFGEEVAIGYTSHVKMGSGRLAPINGMLLFTTKRIIALKGSGKTGLAALAAFGPILWHHQIGSRAKKATQANFDELLLKNRENFAVPYSDIWQLRVKLTTSFMGGWSKVTIGTINGDIELRIAANTTGSMVKDDWGFLQSPPLGLAGKIIIE